MSKKKSSSLPVVVFAVLAVLWGVEVVFFYESLDRAREERDRLAAQAEKDAAELSELKREVNYLDKYTKKLLTDPEFLAREARERLGAASEDEIVIRAEGH